MNLNLENELKEYQAHLITSCYAERTIDVYLRSLREFLRYFQEFQTHPSRDLARIIDCYPKKYKNNTVRAALHSYYYFKMGKKYRTTVQTCYTPPWIEDELKEFQEYLLNVATLQPSTIAPYVKYVNRFLTYSATQGVTQIGEITATHVKKYLLKALQHYKASSKKTVINRIRSFCRYLQFKGGFIDDSILKLPLSVPIWSLSHIPKTLNSQELEIFLASNLTLDDFNWHEGTVLIRLTKSHADRILPISKKLGEAIEDYLLHARQSTDIRQLFLSITGAMEPQ